MKEVIAMYNVIKIKSYVATLSRDCSMLLNTAGKVSLLKLNSGNVEKLYEFAVLKNPSYGAFSSDNKLLAYKSTIGKIAVHDTETGSLILKHNAVKAEGNELYFVQKNKKILSSTWKCDVFTIDIQSGELLKSRIGEGELFGASIIPGLSEDDYFAYCINRNARSSSSQLYKITISANGLEVQLAYNLPDHGVLTALVRPVKLQNVILFSSRSNKCNKLYSFDLISGTWDELIDIQEIYISSRSDSEDELGKVKCMIGTDDGKYIIVACDLGLKRPYIVMIVDVSRKKCIAKFEHNYISNLILFNCEKSLWVGTWERTYVYDFLELIS